VQLLFHPDQLLALALQHLRDRDSGCARDDLGDFLRADLASAATSRPCPSFSALGLLELRLELRNLAVLDLAHLLPVALAARLFHRDAQLLELFLDVLAAGDLRLLGLPDFLEVRVFFSSFAISSSISPRRLRDASSFSRFTASRSMRSWISAGRACPSPRA
jgi:hypothetical protein